MATEFNFVGRNPVPRVTTASFSWIKMPLLHLQLLAGGFLVIAAFLAGSDGEPGGLFAFLYPARSATTMAVILLAVLFGARPPFRVHFAVPLCYCAYLIATCLWSPGPAETLRAAIDFFLVLLSLAVLCNGQPPARIVSAIQNVMAITMVTSLVVALGLPSIGRVSVTSAWSADQAGAWRGTFGEKNGLGCTAAIAFCVLLLGWRNWRLPFPLKLFGLAAALVCMVQARSGNALIGLIAMLLTSLLLAGRVSRWRVFSTWLFVGTIIIVVATSPILPSLFEFIGKDATGSHRTEIWTESLNVWQRSPAVGVGFVEGTLLLLQPWLLKVIGPAARHAHSGYIETLVESGWVGLALLGLTLLIGLWRCSHRPAWMSNDERQAASIYQVILVGALAMAGGDVLSFRLYGGFGVFTWCALIGAYALPRALRPIPMLREGETTG